MDTVTESHMAIAMAVSTTLFFALPNARERVWKAFIFFSLTEMNWAD